jgi:hypothetical protein
LTNTVPHFNASSLFREYAAACLGKVGLEALRAMMLSAGEHRKKFGQRKEIKT